MKDMYTRVNHARYRTKHNSIWSAENLRQLQRVGSNLTEDRPEPIHSQDHEDEDLTMEALLVSRDERAVDQQVTSGYARASRPERAKEGPIEWPGLAYDRKQVTELQQADADIKKILELKAAHPVKPRYGEISHLSPEVKNYWAQ